MLVQGALEFSRYVIRGGGKEEGQSRDSQCSGRVLVIVVGRIESKSSEVGIKIITLTKNVQNIESPYHI